jgi:hypothetical protein
MVPFGVNMLVLLDFWIIKSAALAANEDERSLHRLEIWD